MDREELRRQLAYYRDLGIRTLYLPEGGEGPAAEVQAMAAAESVAADTGQEMPIGAKEGDSKLFSALFQPDAGADTLTRIQEDMGDCKRCRLCAGRNKIVFGSGNVEARLVFVGEGPGADEDAQGLPFVGRAGQLLTQMIDNTAAKEGLVIRRGDAYICNVVKCRPPENRTPEPDEMEICGQFLLRQLLVLKPRAICALGATAAKALLGSREGITKMRGKWHSWRDIPVMPTYHPSYLLRPYNQNAKREAWEDLKKVLHYVYDEPPRPLSDF
ncbi:MAG: uracil-DNA glycosylase [Acidobacteria bacterium]|nr:uracil-DNA glycosylase [Acidobacteriota bacterium]